MGDKLDKLIANAKTLQFDRKGVILDALEEFPKCYRRRARHRLFSEAKPEPKQSVRTGRYGHYTAKKKKDYMKKLASGLLATYGLRTPPIEGPIVLTVLYSFPWTTAYKKDSRVLGWLFNTKRPDLDNLLKPLKDSMSGICYLDDSQIVGTMGWKIRTNLSFVAVILDEVEETSMQPFAQFA
jgi:crossover junction endodeoxyribonuclease RusA